MSRENIPQQKKLKILAVCLLGVSALSLALALLYVSGVIEEPEEIEAMKGSEAVGGRYLNNSNL